jgi:CelD/BcsL family acetyltransferase involved in cellulose biosynthesis
VHASWTRNRRKTIRRKLADFEGAGGSFEWIDEPSAVTAALPTVFALHAARRRSLGAATRFGASATNRAFHRALATTSEPSCGAWVQLARVGTDVVGALYGFRLGGCYSVYQSGWRPDPVWEQLSLGLIQYSRSFDRVIEAGASRFDMCRGADPYKLRFATDRVVETTYLDPSGVAGRLVLVRAALRRRRLRRRPAPGAA